MGVVYHGNYPTFLELGRTEWLRSLGVSYKDMEEEGVILPVISMNFEFKKSAMYDDLLMVKTTLKRVPSVKIEFDYEIYNEKGEIITIANTVLAFLNKKTMKPIKCPEYILDKLV